MRNPRRDRTFLCVIALTMAIVSSGTLGASEVRAQPCPSDGVTTAADYVQFSECVLEVIRSHDWDQLPAADQVDLATYDEIVGNALQTLTEVMLTQVIPAVPPGEVADFEFIVQNGRILEEMVALQALLDSPLSADRKKKAKKQGEDSVKALLKKLAERAPWGLGAFIQGLIDVINEILAVIRGGDTAVSTIESGALMQQAILLGQISPNPFNASTEVEYVVAERGRVVVRVFDLGGKLVRTLVDEVQDARTHDLRWDGRNDRGEAQASGVYFFEVEAGGQRQARKSLMIK